MTQADLFIELADPDEDGFSRRVGLDEFVGRYEPLDTFGNGGSWCRSDGKLGETYNVVRHKERGRIVAVELQGFKKVSPAKPIPASIRKVVESRRCAVLDTGKVEVDHKDGWLEDPRLSDPARVTADDFQALSNPANMAKREHCKKCKGLIYLSAHGPAWRSLAPAGRHRLTEHPWVLTRRRAVWENRCIAWSPGPRRGRDGEAEAAVGQDCRAYGERRPRRGAGEESSELERWR